MRHLAASAVDLPLRVAARRVLCLFALLTIALCCEPFDKDEDIKWGPTMGTGQLEKRKRHSDNLVRMKGPNAMVVTRAKGQDD